MNSMMMMMMMMMMTTTMVIKIITTTNFPIQRQRKILNVKICPCKSTHLEA